jgi:biopolymer transport protein ExbD
MAATLKGYIEAMPAKVKTSGVLLNLVADQETPYESIFAVSRYLRINGVQSVLFVAEGEKQ